MSHARRQNTSLDMYVQYKRHKIEIQVFQTWTHEIIRSEFLAKYRNELLTYDHNKRARPTLNARKIFADLKEGNG